MPAPLSISRRTAAGVTILELNGRLVFDESDSLFKEHVTADFVAGGRNLLIDLSHVDYMDSGGVGALVAMFLHVTHRGGRFKLLCPSHRSCRVLRITHLLTVFEVFQDEEQAIRSFMAGPDASGSLETERIAR